MAASHLAPEGVRLSRRRERSGALSWGSSRPLVDVSGASRLERAGCGRLGLRWKPRASCCVNRGPGGWRRLQERGARCSGLPARAPGPERRGRVLLFGLGVWRPFPQREKGYFLTPPFQPPFQGRVTQCPAPFLSSLGHRGDNPKKAHHNRAVSKAPSLGIRWWGSRCLDGG